MKLNDYFQNMENCLADYYDRVNKADKARSDAVAKYGYGKETDKYFERLEKIRGERPYSNGQVQAYHVVDRCKGEELVVSDFVWEDDIHDFIQTLREGGIKDFVLTTQSTALMADIHGFVDEGCSIDGTCKIVREGYYGEEVVLGLRFKMGGDAA